MPPALRPDPLSALLHVALLNSPKEAPMDVILQRALEYAESTPGIDLTGARNQLIRMAELFDAPYEPAPRFDAFRWLAAAGGPVIVGGPHQPGIAFVVRLPDGL